MPLIKKEVPRPEYPRPQFARSLWFNLNGEWEFAFDDAMKGSAKVGMTGASSRAYHCSLRVSTLLSGINDKAVHEIVWYARSFELPEEFYSRDLLLNFGAVDYAATVWVNGQEVGHNRGGHVPFQFDIAPYVKAGENRLTVRVEDRQDPKQPRGKQSHTGLPESIDYYCTTGIWQTVWLEPVPSIRIEELRIITHAKRNLLELTVFLHAPSAAWRVEVEVLEQGKREAIGEDQTAVATGRLAITIPYAKLWSPESPHLYDLQVRLYDGDKLLDEVGSYVGLRGIELRERQVSSQWKADLPENDPGPGLLAGRLS